MAIASEEELEITQTRIAQLERVVAATTRRLSGNPATLAAMLSMYQDQLDEMQNEIKEFLGLGAIAPSTVRLAFGAKEEWGSTTTMSALEAVLGDFRGALTTIAEALVEGKPREAGRPTARASKAADLRIVRFSPGSVVIHFEPSLDDPGSAELAEKSIRLLEEAVLWVESGEATPPKDLENQTLQRMALRQVQRLAPRESGPVLWIEIQRSRAPAARGVRLTSGTLRAASVLVEATYPVQTVSVTGRLREIDLDRGSFALVDARKTRHACKVPKELLQQCVDFVASQESVIVRAKKLKKTLDVIAIEPLRSAQPKSPGR